MEATVVQREKVQSEPRSWSEQQAAKKTSRVDIFRYQKWVDGDGKLWIVILTFGHDNKGRFGANVCLLDVDNETTIDVPRAEFEGWVTAGHLKRVDTPILL